MSGADRFAALSQQLAEELQQEHERQISELVAEISALKSKLEGLEGLPSQPSSRSQAGGAPSGGPKEETSPRPRLRKRRRRLSVRTRTPPILSNFCPLAFVEQVVFSYAFEIFFTALIALNGVVLAFEAQHHSISVASYLGYQDAPDPHDGWEGAKDAFQLVGRVLGTLFMLEVALRIVALRGRFPFKVWNWLDLAIAVVWLVGEAGSSVLPINPQVIRLTRFARLVRLLKLIKKIGGFDALFLMVASLQQSAVILAWSGCLLLVVLAFNALLLNGCLAEFYFKDDRFPESERLELFRFMGTFTASLFSMFELTLANWPPISRMLYEYVTQWFIVLTLVHKLTIGFAVIGVINGVLIQETFKAASNDDAVMLRRAHEASRVHGKKMRRLMNTADASGEGKLDVEEFRGMFGDPGIRAWLASMEFTPADVDALFQMMDDDGDGALTVDEVICGVGKLKGAARNLDLHMMLREQRQLRSYIERRFGEPI